MSILQFWSDNGIEIFSRDLVLDLLICLSVQLIGACYTLPVKSLWLVSVVFSLVVEKTSSCGANIQSGHSLDTDISGCITSCGGGKTNPDFSCSFFWIFCPDPQLL